MDVSPGQLQALQNLARKQGETVDWINIGDARALTVLGLAERHSAGWQITKAGSALLTGKPPENAPDGSSDALSNDTLPFRSPSP